MFESVRISAGGGVPMTTRASSDNLVIRILQYYIEMTRKGWIILNIFQ